MDIHRIFGRYFKEEAIAGIASLLSKRLEEGHICVYRDDPELPAESTGVWEALNASGWVGNPDRVDRPFILHEERIYLQRYWQYETAILDKIAALLSSEKDLPEDARLHRMLQKNSLAPSVSGQLPEVDWQTIAVLHALKYRFTILTGGPGTGKTTTVARILSAMLEIEPQITIALAAPTGKAAARMNEALMRASKRLKLPAPVAKKMAGIEASTIHRLLGFRYHDRSFRFDPQRPLPYDLLIVDEASMLDAPLFARLVQAIPDTGQLILLGDRNQLSAVGAGSIFGDLCRSVANPATIPAKDLRYYHHFIPAAKALQAIPDSDRTSLLSGHIIELQTSHRFDKNRGIGRFSHLVLQGVHDSEKLIAPFAKDETLLIDSDAESPHFKELLKEYERYAREPDTAKALRLLSGIRTLCTTHEGKTGTMEFNRRIDNYLRAQNLLGPPTPYFHNQPILIRSNNYNLGLFNGDEGLIRQDPQTGVLTAWFEGEDGELRGFSPAMLEGAYLTAFAMTIHKSQGSEFDTVIVVLPGDAEHVLLTRELLYTAVTRAKEKVLILGSGEVIRQAVERQSRRMSGIIPRLSACSPL